MLKATSNGDPAEARTRDPSVRSPRLYHCASPPSLFDIARQILYDLIIQAGDRSAPHKQLNGCITTWGIPSFIAFASKQSTLSYLTFPQFFRDAKAVCL